MNYISTNITLFGNCEKAIEFYGKNFSNCTAEITRYGEVAEALGFHETVSGKEQLIYQAKLMIKMDNNSFVLTLSDSPSLLFMEHSANSNNVDNITLIIEIDSEAYLEKLYKGLLEGGKSNIAPRVNKLGVLEGSLIDQFGVCWILRANSK